MRHKRPSSVPSLLLATLAAVTSPTFAAESTITSRRPPNILWIVGENLKIDLGCYGAENVETPNLDALAARGLRYTRVFSTAPVCATSRSAFMTGMYQTTTDTHAMWCHRDDDYRLPEGVRPITHRLQDAGYFTANIKTIEGRVVGSGKLDLNFVNEGPIYQSDDWSKLNSISGMDRRIGTILNQLREDGLEENTIVIFFGDNGRLEARGIHWCYDSGLHEIHNLVDSPDPEHRMALAQLRAALDTWITETGDVGQWPEPPEVMEGLDQKLHDWFGTPDWHSKQLKEQ